MFVPFSVHFLATVENVFLKLIYCHCISTSYAQLHSTPWSNISIGRSVEWPKARRHRVATHLSGPLFVIVGGAGHQVCTNDMWLCDTATKLWKKVLFLECLLCMCSCLLPFCVTML